VKTEVVVFETNQRVRQYTIIGVINVAGASVQFTEAVRLLGATLDAMLSIDRYVTRRCLRLQFSHSRAATHSVKTFI
jgi:hypothetical protein